MKRYIIDIVIIIIICSAFAIGYNLYQQNFPKTPRPIIENTYIDETDVEEWLEDNAFDYGYYYEDEIMFFVDDDLSDYGYYTEDEWYDMMYD